MQVKHTICPTNMITALYKPKSTARHDAAVSSVISCEEFSALRSRATGGLALLRSGKKSGSVGAGEVK